jgi:hypothetical protein
VDRWTAQQFTDHWAQYCTWFPSSAGCDTSGSLDLSLSMDDDGLSLSTGTPPTAAAEAEAKKKTALQPVVEKQSPSSSMGQRSPDGTIEFTLFSGPWKAEVLDISSTAHENVKWLHPHPITDKYVEVMSDCADWMHSTGDDSCYKRGMLKYLDVQHKVIGTSPVEEMCDSRAHNSWNNAYIAKLPEGTAQVIAFADAEKADGCGPVYFTTRFLTEHQQKGLTMFTLPAGRGGTTRKFDVQRQGANSLTADIVCVDDMDTLPAWCRKGGSIALEDSQGNEILSLDDHGCDSSDPSKRASKFNLQMPLATAAVTAKALKIDADTIDCGRVRFLMRVWNDPSKTDPPTPAPTASPTAVRTSCSHMKCWWDEKTKFLHVRHVTKEWGTRHKCQRDETAATGCKCSCTRT